MNATLDVFASSSLHPRLTGMNVYDEAHEFNGHVSLCITESRSHSKDGQLLLRRGASRQTLPLHHDGSLILLNQ